MPHYAVACDPDRGGSAILRVVSTLADAGDHVTVIQVVNPLEEPWRDPERSLTEAVEVVVDRRREAIHAQLAAAGLNADLIVEPSASGEETAPAIARIARGCDANILIVLSKRASGLRGMLLGSVAQGLLTVSPCPVLVVRPDDDPTPREDR